MPHISTLDLEQEYGKFILEPLEKGYGQTIGNALRRVLLSSIQGAAVCAVRIDKVFHEFAPIPGLKEDTTEENLVSLAADIGATKLPVDTYWLDAGWNEGGFARGQGNMNPDPKRFPHGLAPVGAAARAAGEIFVLTSRAWRDGEGAVRMRVAPERLPLSDPLATVQGTSNLLLLHTDLMGTLGTISIEPRVEQTAYGVLSDLVDITRTL